jgi:dihydroneopterin aldolase
MQSLSPTLPALPPTEQSAIVIRNWVLPARLGVLASEKNAPQRVRLTIALHLENNWRQGRDDLADTVCYDRLRQKISTRLLAAHTELVETMAEHIAAICLVEPGIKAVQISIEKLDIYTDGSTVGVDIIRHRHNI